MQKVNFESFQVIGIAITTSNQNGQALQDIGQLWNRFLTEGIPAKIPNRIDNEILSIYTNYHGDHNQPYDTILGCRVSSIDQVPEGMVSQVFEGGSYASFVAKGDLRQGVVGNVWGEIWSQNLNRAYTADFEVYGAKAQNPQDVEVDIYVGIKA